MELHFMLVILLSLSQVCLSMPNNKDLLLVMDKVEKKQNASQAESFTVDLDAEPKERWKNLANQLDPDTVVDGIRKLLSILYPSLTPEKIAIAERIAADMDRYIGQQYSDEMRGLSAATGIPLGDVVLVNIIYDFAAYGNSSLNACTSIVAVDNTSHIIHGRNLDFPVADHLKNVTIQLDFQRGGKTVYTASSYLGYVGITTGSRHGAFSISGNQRNYGTFWDNVISALEGGHLTFFALRKVLDESSDYKSALNELVNTPTVAPVYFILGGLEPSEGALVVRNGMDVAVVKHLQDFRGHPWFLVETNYDPWKQPPKEDDRRDVAIKAMLAIGQKNMTPDQLYKVLSTPPILNVETTYTTIMSAHDADLYRTMVRFDGPSK